MTTVVQPSALDLLLAGDLDVTDGNLKAVLISDAYTYSGSHNYLDDVAVGARLSTVTLSSVAVASGVVTWGAVTFPDVPTGDTVIGIWIISDTGVTSTSPLVAWIDRTADTVPISIDTNDGDIVATWPSSRGMKI